MHDRQSDARDPHRVRVRWSHRSGTVGPVRGLEESGNAKVRIHLPDGSAVRAGVDATPTAAVAVAVAVGAVFVSPMSTLSARVLPRTGLVGDDEHADYDRPRPRVTAGYMVEEAKR